MSIAMLCAVLCCAQAELIRRNERALEEAFQPASPTSLDEVRRAHACALARVHVCVCACVRRQPVAHSTGGRGASADRELRLVPGDGLCCGTRVHRDEVRVCACHPLAVKQVKQSEVTVRSTRRRSCFGAACCGCTPQALPSSRRRSMLLDALENDADDDGVSGGGSGGSDGAAAAGTAGADRMAG